MGELEGFCDKKKKKKRRWVVFCSCFPALFLSGSPALAQLVAQLVPFARNWGRVTATSSQPFLFIFHPESRPSA